MSGREGVALVERGGHLWPVPWEDLIDAGVGTPEMIAWDARRDAERKARWDALPRRTRFMRRHVLTRWYEARQRAVHAWDALRGIECEP